MSGMICPVSALHTAVLLPTGWPLSGEIIISKISKAKPPLPIGKGDFSYRIFRDATYYSCVGVW